MAEARAEGSVAISCYCDDSNPYPFYRLSSNEFRCELDMLSTLSDFYLFLSDKCS